MATDTQHLEDSMYARCLEAARKDGATSIAHLQLNCRLSYNGALLFIQRMEREGVIGPANEDGMRPVIG